jgi:hypothetical protein
VIEAKILQRSEKFWAGGRKEFRIGILISM